MRPFRADTTYGEVKVATNSLHTFAYCLIDPRALAKPQGFRTQPTTIPGTPGDRPNPYRIASATHTLECYFTGYCDEAGTAHADVLDGYYTNMASFEAKFLTPPTPPSSTLPATLTLPSASELDADVQVLGFDLRDSFLTYDVYELDLWVAAGSFS